MEELNDSKTPIPEGYKLNRFTLKYLFLNILAILNFEKGILFTIKELVIRPRVVIEEYLKIDRSKLIHPIRFLVFSTALSTFLSLILIANNIKFSEFKTGNSKGIELVENEDPVESEKTRNFGFQIGTIVASNLDKFTFISVLFYSFFTLLFFSKSGYNLTENLIINSYLVSITNVLSIVFFIPAYFIGNFLLTIIPSAIGLVFTFYFWVCVYDRKTFLGVMKSLLVYISSYLSFIIIVVVIGTIYYFNFFGD